MPLGSARNYNDATPSVGTWRSLRGPGARALPGFWFILGASSVARWVVFLIKLVLRDICAGYTVESFNCRLKQYSKLAAEMIESRLCRYARWHCTRVGRSLKF